MGDYQHIELVSLEHALQQMIDAEIVSIAGPVDVRDHLHIVLVHNGAEPGTTLTRELQAKAAVSLYTIEGPVCYRINHILRARQMDRVGPCLEMIKWIMLGLCQHCDEPIEFTGWRGVPIDPRGEYYTGKEFTWYSFTSLSKDKEKALEFCYTRSVPVIALFSVRCRSSRSLEACAMYRDEAEWLLPPCTRFRVTGVAPIINDGAGMVEVYIEEIGPDAWPMPPPAPGLTVYAAQASPALARTPSTITRVHVDDYVRLRDPTMRCGYLSPGEIAHVRTVLSDNQCVISVAGLEDTRIDCAVLVQVGAPSPLDTTLRLGDSVRVRMDIGTPTFGWQGLNGSAVGRLRSLNELGGCLVDYPQQWGWRCKLSELELAATPLAPVSIAAGTAPAATSLSGQSSADAGRDDDLDRAIALSLSKSAGTAECTVSPDLSVGSIVAVRPDVTEPALGWGVMQSGMAGRIDEIRTDGVAVLTIGGGNTWKSPLHELQPASLPSVSVGEGQYVRRLDVPAAPSKDGLCRERHQSAIVLLSPWRAC